MSKDNIELIKELANIRIDTILDSLGIEYKEKYHSYVTACPVHGGDRKDAVSYHIERGIWKCFSRSCEKEFGSDIFGLVRGVKKCNFAEALQYVKKFVDVNLSAADIKKIKDEKANREFIVTSRKKKDKVRIYPKSSLHKLVYHNYLERRGLPRSIIEEYHIGACLESGMYMSNRIVVPVLNVEKEIVGFTGRTLDEDWQNKGIPKWKHSLGAWKESNLFNIDRAAEYISKTGLAIICEGPLDVLKLVQAGIYNAVAILGKDLQNGQMTLLMNCGATKLLLALDNDKAGKIGTNSAMKTASCLFDVEVVNIPPNRKDVGEMEINEIVEVFKCKKTNYSTVST